ncbi:hypothetical protein MKW94_013152 [Papaver nudicaule]|uniref:Fe2OG dioxygenase domain-containing protein n=2 Tax=Magnoliopsida TaxID=3398 RepID=A0AA41S9Z0_PAPNU|nr:hypothetical protein [Papaver nudicaule]
MCKAYLNCICGLEVFFTVNHIFLLLHIRRMKLSRFDCNWVKPEIISWAPRIIVLHNFLSLEDEECGYLKAIARHLQISTVVDAKTGKDKFRMFLSNEERKYPIAIEKRISVFSQVPVENGELVQVLRYEKNQYYKPHHDYFSDTELFFHTCFVLVFVSLSLSQIWFINAVLCWVQFNLKRGGQRIATVHMYLSDNVEGGETYFPMFNLKRGGQRIATVLMYLSDNVEGGETYFPMAGIGECSCGGKMVKGLSVKPNKGDAVLFWSMGLDGKEDPSCIHGGCEVLSGEKWSATKWMRQKTTN